MNLEEFFEEWEYEAMKHEHSFQLEKGKAIAKQNSWNFDKFKNFIGQFLTFTPDEDQWVFDYESWLLTLVKYKFEHPANWALEYYQDFGDGDPVMWDMDKFNKIWGG